MQFTQRKPIFDLYAVAAAFVVFLVGPLFGSSFVLARIMSIVAYSIYMYAPLFAIRKSGKYLIFSFYIEY